VATLHETLNINHEDSRHRAWEGSDRGSGELEEVAGERGHRSRIGRQETKTDVRPCMERPSQNRRSMSFWLT
jgi:hypothetical protein